MKIVCWFLIFCSGINFANNLSGLIEINTEFEPSWWAVGLSLFFAVVCSMLTFGKD